MQLIKKRVKNYKKNPQKKGLNKQRGGWYGISPWYAHEDEGVIIVRKKTRQRGGGRSIYYLK